MEWCEAGTPFSRGGVLLRLRTRLLRLSARPALVMQLVGGWPDGPRICLYMPHIVYLVAKLFEQCSCYLMMLSISYAVIQIALRPDMMISVIYPSHDIYSTRQLLVITRLPITPNNWIATRIEAGVGVDTQQELFYFVTQVVVV